MGGFDGEVGLGGGVGILGFGGGGVGRRVGEAEREVLVAQQLHALSGIGEQGTLVM